MTSTGLWQLCAAVLLLLPVHLDSWAQGFPSRAVRIVLTTGPGGAPDLTARLIAERLTNALGQSFLVEHRLGAGGSVAHPHVASSPADGHTLLFGADTNMVISPHLMPPSDVDNLRDFVAVAPLASHFFMLVTHSGVPASNFPAFIEYAKRSEKPLAAATVGVGTQQSLAIMRLRRSAGIQLLDIPFKSGALATAATASGEVAVSFASGASADSWIKAGKLKPLLITAARRSEIYPDLPAIGEFFPGTEAIAWFGLFAPAGTPDPVLRRLREEIVRALAIPELKQRLWNAGGLEPLVMPVEEFSALVRRDYERYGQLLRDMGMAVKR
jgi:tripartite-type tricarboxylate transporter receptor subunit TctC